MHIYDQDIEMPASCISNWDLPGILEVHYSPGTEDTLPDAIRVYWIREINGQLYRTALYHCGVFPNVKMLNNFELLDIEERIAEIENQKEAPYGYGEV